MSTQLAVRAPSTWARSRQVQDVDLHVGRRIRERRLMLGLTQQTLAERVGITYQQQHKYEVGANRVAVGRLHAIAQALNVDVSFFFEGLNSAPTQAPTVQQSLLLELARNFTRIQDRSQQQALADLARALAAVPAPAAALDLIEHDVVEAAA